MEVGNGLFGHSTNNFPIQNRSVVHSFIWHRLLDLCDCDCYGMHIVQDDNTTILGGYENELFAINPYYWGDDENLMSIPNFIYKPTGLTIEWYKYPFRDSYLNRKATNNQLKKIWKECIKFMREKRRNNV